MDIEEPDSVMRELSNRRKLIEQLRTEKWELRKKILSTEHFDLNCKGVTEHAPISAKLNGVSAIVKIDGSAVVPGEVGVDLEGLYLYFNPADVGKTIELECTRYWNK